MRPTVSEWFLTVWTANVAKTSGRYRMSRLAREILSRQASIVKKPIFYALYLLMLDETRFVNSAKNHRYRIFLKKNPYRHMQLSTIYFIDTRWRCSRLWNEISKFLIRICILVLSKGTYYLKNNFYNFYTDHCIFG